jgi:hypothetical protein
MPSSSNLVPAEMDVQSTTFVVDLGHRKALPTSQ